MYYPRKGYRIGGLVHCRRRLTMLRIDAAPFNLLNLHTSKINTSSFSSPTSLPQHRHEQVNKLSLASPSYTEYPLSHSPRAHTKACVDVVAKTRLSWLTYSLSRILLNEPWETQ